MLKDQEKAEKALREFVDAINATGGATVDRKGYTVPVADQEWSDLGAAYEAACAALGEEPKIDDTLYELPEDLTLDEEGKEVSIPPEQFFDDPEGAVCPHCNEHTTDPNHAANCSAWPEGEVSNGEED